MKEYILRVSLDYPHLSLGELETLITSIYEGNVKLFSIYGKFYHILSSIDEEKMYNIAKRSAGIKTVFSVFSKYKLTDLSINDLIQVIKSQLDRFQNDLFVKIYVSYHSVVCGKDDEFIKKIYNILTETFKKYMVFNPACKNKIAIFIFDYVYITKIIYDNKKFFNQRRPSRRPAFSPSSLHPKLARILINLSGCKKSILVDPFCGVGGILIEATILGIENIGIEISRKWVYGAKKNVCWVDNEFLYTHLIMGDACNPPLRKVKYVVTDPPYGRIASTYGESVMKLYNKFLVSFYKIMDKNGTLVFLSPSNLKIKNSNNEYRYIEQKKYIIPVHGSLTRYINVWRKFS